MEITPKVGKDEVIAKLKDDGDFDKLRLKIIRKLKDNEELRNEITSIVKQSAALNRAGAENMKPRQLSDAIYDEVGNNVMSWISDGLWEIIRSGDGMKGEITETVQSVYNKLVNPKGKEEGESSTHDRMSIQKGAENNGSILAAAGVVDDSSSDSEPTEPPGFSVRSDNHNDYYEEQHKQELQPPRPDETGPVEEHLEDNHHSHDVLDPEDVDLHVPPGFSVDMEQKQLCSGSDEDPDVPPGFG